MVTDEDLAIQIQSGSETAIELLVNRYHRQIHGYIARQLQFDGMVDDLVQETFIRVCTRISQYQYPRPFRPWLYQIAHNLCRDFWKSSYFKQHSQAVDIDTACTLLSTYNGVESIYNKQENRQEVIKALAELKPNYREILILRFYQELKLSEIAEVLNIPLGTVKWRLFHGLRLMKEQLRCGGEENAQAK